MEQLMAHIGQRALADAKVPEQQALVNAQEDTGGQMPGFGHEVAPLAPDTASSIHALAAEIQQSMSGGQQQKKPEAAEKVTKGKAACTPKKAPMKRPAAASLPLPKAQKNFKSLPFPGKPRKATEPMEANGYRIYTDLNNQQWRIKKQGERNDKAVSYKQDAEEAWAKVNSFLKTCK